MGTSEHALRPGRCWYCGEETLRNGDPPEHVIPAALGGTLTTDRVCERCNHRASVIDQRLAQDYFVALERNRHELPDRKGAPPPHVKQKAIGRDDGKPYRINTRGGGFALEPVPQVRMTGDGEFNASAASEEEAMRAVERIVGDLDAQGFRVNEIRREKLPPIEVQVSVKVRPIDYVRAAGKITLAALSLVWPDEWLDTPDAKRLQRWVRDEVPTDGDGNTIWGFPGREPDFLSRICTPPEHLILLFPHGDEVTSMLVLFGTMILPVRVATAGQPQPKTVWRMNPLKRSLDEMTLDDLLLEAALRAQGKL